MDNSTSLIGTGTACIDYVQDTLFGPISKRAECQIRLFTLNLDGQPGLELDVQAPPDDLHKAHTLSFVLDGDRYSGIVRHSKRGENRSLQLQMEMGVRQLSPDQ